MSDAASLSFSIDSSGADRAKQSLDQMTQSSKQAAEAAAILIKAQQAQIDQLQQLVLLQGQTSQGHSNLSSTIMPLAGALAIGAGSFAAVNYAMNSFTDLIQNKVGSAIDALNQRLYTSFSLMGSLGLNNGNIGNAMMASQLNQQITGVSPLFNLTSQYTGTVMGIGAQGGANVGASFGNPYNLQMQTMMRNYGINPMDSSAQNQQSLIDAMLNTRPSATRTADFGALGLTPDQIQSAYVRQQMMNARNPYEVYRSNTQINASEASLASQANSAQWGVYATQEYARARALPSLSSSAQIGFDSYLNDSWLGRFLGTGQNQYKSSNDLAAIRNYSSGIQAQGAYGFQDLLNHFDGQRTSQSLGQDFSQAFNGFMQPTYATTQALRSDLGFGISPQYFSKAPATQPQAISTPELDNAANNLASTLGNIAPSADQIANIRNGWNTLNDLMGGNGQKGSLTSLLQGYTDNFGNFQPGLQQEVQGMPGGSQLYNSLSGLINAQLNDFKNQMSNPLTYQNTVANQAQMSIAMASNSSAGGLLQAQYSALQKLGLDPTSANIAAMQNNPAFQSAMGAYNQQPFLIAGAQNQQANLSMAATGIDMSIPVNDRSLYAPVINQAINTPNSFASNLVSGGLTNGTQQQIQSYTLQQAKKLGFNQTQTNWAMGVMQSESSGGKFNGPSATGNIGPFQIGDVPKNISAMGDPNNWQTNVNMGLTYLSQLWNQFGGKQSVATAAYHDGPNSAGVQQYFLTGDPSGLSAAAKAEVGQVDNYSMIAGMPGVSSQIAAANAQSLASAQTQQQQSAISDQGLIAAGSTLAQGGAGSGYNAQLQMAYAQAMAAPSVDQSTIISTAQSQLQAQSLYRFGALQGQTANLSNQNRLLMPAYNATGLTPLQYNQGILTADALASAVPINNYQPANLANATNTMYIQNAQLSAQQQAGQQVAQLVNQSSIINAGSPAGPTQYSQNLSAAFAAIKNSPGYTNPDGSLTPLGQQAMTITQSNAQQSAINTGQNQLAMANFQNTGLAAQANINPFLSPTQQAMQLGQIQITQQQQQAYGLIDKNGQVIQAPGTNANGMNPQQQAQTNALISANNTSVQDQQSIQQRQQVTQDIQDMSDTVVTSLEKLATGGYNAGYILKAAASNIAGLGAQALVFQPLSNTISQGVGDLGSIIAGGSASSITNGGIFGSLANGIFGLGGNNNGPNGTGGHSGASVSSGGTSILQTALGALGSAINFFGGGAFSSDADIQGMIGSPTSSVSAASLAMHQGVTMAKGGLFSAGQVIPFATGGVVDQPSNFPMAGGTTGLMGEAGPEAIVPLTRGPDGKLGIASSGGNQSPSGATVNIHAPITVSSGQNGKLTAAQQADMQSQFQQMLYTSVKQVITNEQRNGGTLQRY